MSPAVSVDPDFGCTRKCGFLWSFRDSFLEDLYHRRMAVLLTDDFSRIATVSAIVSSILAIVCGEETVGATEQFCMRVFLLSVVIVLNLGLVAFFFLNKRPRAAKERGEKKEPLGTDSDPGEDLTLQLVPPRTYVFPVWLMTAFALWVVTVFALTLPPVYGLWYLPGHHEHHQHRVHDHLWKHSFFHKGHTSRFFFILNDLGNLYAFRHHVTATLIVQVYTAIAFVVVEMMGHSLHLGDKLAVAVLVISFAFSCLGVAGSYVMSELSRANVCHLVQFFQYQKEAQSESRQVIEAVQCFGCATMMFEGPLASFQHTAFLGEDKEESNGHAPPPPPAHGGADGAAPPQRTMPPHPDARCTWVSRRTSECAGVAVDVLEGGGLPALVAQGAGTADRRALAKVCTDSLEVLVSELESRCGGCAGVVGGLGEGEGGGCEWKGKGVLERGGWFRRWLFRLFASREKGTMGSVWENTQRQRQKEEASEEATARQSDVESGWAGKKVVRETENPFLLFGSSLVSEPLKMSSSPGRFFEVTAVCRLQQMPCEVGAHGGGFTGEQMGEKNEHLQGLLERGGVCVILTFRDVTSRVMEAKRAWALLENFASMLGTAAWQADSAAPASHLLHNKSPPGAARGRTSGDVLRTRQQNGGDSEWKAGDLAAGAEEKPWGMCGEVPEGSNGDYCARGGDETSMSNSRASSGGESDDSHSHPLPCGNEAAAVAAEAEKEGDLEMGILPQTHNAADQPPLSHPPGTQAEAFPPAVRTAHIPAKSEGPKLSQEGEREGAEGSTPAIRFRAVYQSKVIEALTGRKLITFQQTEGAAGTGDIPPTGVTQHGDVLHHPTVTPALPGEEPQRPAPIPAPTPLIVPTGSHLVSDHAGSESLALDRLKGFFGGEGGGFGLGENGGGSVEAGGELLPVHPPSACQRPSLQEGDVGEAEAQRSQKVAVRLSESMQGGACVSLIKSLASPATGRLRRAPASLWSVIESSEGETEKEREMERDAGEEFGVRLWIQEGEGGDVKQEGGGRAAREKSKAPTTGVLTAQACLPSFQSPISPRNYDDDNEENPQRSKITTQSPIIETLDAPPSAAPPTAVDLSCPHTQIPPAVNVLWTEFVAPPYKDQVEKAIERCLTVGEPFRLLLMIERPDGQLRWFECGGKQVVPAVPTGQQRQRVGGKGKDEDCQPYCSGTDRAEDRQEMEVSRGVARSPCTALKDSPATTAEETASVRPSAPAPPPPVTSVLGFVRDVTAEENMRRRTGWLLARSQQTLDAVFQGTIRAHLQEMVVLEASLLFRLWTGRILDGTPLTSVLRTQDAQDLRKAVFAAASSVVWFPSRVLLRTPLRRPQHSKSASSGKAQQSSSLSVPPQSNWEPQHGPLSPSPSLNGLQNSEADRPSIGPPSVHTDSCTAKRAAPLSQQSHVGLLADGLADAHGILASVVAVIDQADPACATLNFYGLAPVDSLTTPNHPPPRPPPQVQLQLSQRRNRRKKSSTDKNPPGGSSVSVHAETSRETNIYVPPCAPPSRSPWATQPLSSGSSPSAAGPLKFSERFGGRRGVSFSSQTGQDKSESEPREENACASIPTCPPPSRPPVPPPLRAATEPAEADRNRRSTSASVCL